MKSRSVLLIFLSLSLFNTFGMQSSLELLQRGVDSVSEAKSDTTVLTPDQKTAQTYVSAGESVVHEVPDAKPEENKYWSLCKKVLPYTPYAFCLWDYYRYSSAQFPFELLQSEKRSVALEKTAYEVIDNSLIPGNFHGIYHVDDTSLAFCYRDGNDSFIGIGEGHYFDRLSKDQQQFVFGHECGHICENHSLIKTYAFLFLPLISEVIIKSSKLACSLMKAKFGNPVTLPEKVEDRTVTQVLKFTAGSIVDFAEEVTQVVDNSIISRYVVPVILAGALSQYLEMRADAFAVRAMNSGASAAKFFTNPSDAYNWDIINSIGIMDEIRKYGIRDFLHKELFISSHPPGWVRANMCKLYSRYWLGNES